MILSTVELSSDPRVGVERLYRAYRQDVYRSLLRDLGGPADADDCTQAVFLSAMRALDRGCRPRAARAWLLAIAKNVARKRWRERAQPAVELDDDTLPAGNGADDARRELFAVLEELPAAQRNALVLHELYGLDYAEISALTDQTQAGIETAVFRARRTVRTAMRDAGALQHDAASKLLGRLVDGKLTRNEREAVAAHVQTCPSCAADEAALRDGKGRGRSRFVFWVLSIPSAAQRLVGLLQASPARGLGAIGACALGLAAMPGDRPVDPSSGPATPSVVGADVTPRPAAAAAPSSVRASKPDPRAVTHQQPTPVTRRSATPPGRRAAVERGRLQAGSPVVPKPGRETRAPADQPARPAARAERPAGSNPQPGAAKSAIVSVPSLPAPVATETPVDVERTVGNLVDVVGAATSGDLKGTGAAVDATVGGVLEDAGLPALPPVTEPLAGTVEGLGGAVGTTAGGVPETANVSLAG